MITKFLRCMIPIAVLAFITAGCGDDQGDKTADTITKEEAALMGGKNDRGGDLCQILSWYGDGVCDPFCLRPDPDCGGTCADDSECAADEECVDGLCDPIAANTNCGGIAGLTCSAGEFCLYDAAAMCGAADQMGTCTTIPQACYEIYAPVCGCDGVTYSNDCYANAAGTSVASEGECGGTPACASNSDCAAREVCVDGVCQATNPAMCAANSDCANGETCVDGVCQLIQTTTNCGGIAGLTCGSGEFCNYPIETMCGSGDQFAYANRCPKRVTRFSRPYVVATVIRIRMTAMRMLQVRRSFRPASV